VLCNIESSIGLGLVLKKKKKKGGGDPRSQPPFWTGSSPIFSPPNPSEGPAREEQKFCQVPHLPLMRKGGGAGPKGPTPPPFPIKETGERRAKFLLSPSPPFNEKRGRSRSKRSDPSPFPHQRDRREESKISAKSLTPL